MKTNASKKELETALKAVNKMYKGNIRFKNLEELKKGCSFTLTVNDSAGPGARRGFSGQRLAAACWHVHGNFFDELFKINPDAWVRAGSRKITKESGNWDDWNIGTTRDPLYYSEACNC